MKARGSLYVTVVVLLTILGLGVGCTKAPNDAQISSDVQQKINADSGLQDKQLSVQSESGVVTLAGNVDNDAQRTAAARYASEIAGVKSVVNNLQVAPPPQQTAEAAPAPPPPEEKPRPTRQAKRHTPQNRSTSDDTTTTASAPPETTTPATSAVTPPPPAPAPPPPPQKVTIPSGTTLAIRLVDTIDTETSQQGQTFHATLDSPLSVEGEVAIPTGYNVEGHIVELKSAGKFAGQSVLALQLDRIAVGNKYYSVQTDQYRKQGSSRGKNTAEKVGAGAGIGAIIGAIAGGGKGAAIGAAAGGGLGGGVQAATKGQQIKLPSETVLNFTLQAPVTVVPAQRPNEGRPRVDSQ